MNTLVSVPPEKKQYTQDLIYIIFLATWAQPQIFMWHFSKSRGTDKKIKSHSAKKTEEKYIFQSNCEN